VLSGKLNPDYDGFVLYQAQGDLNEALATSTRQFMNLLR
jgi:hypothetical protein